MVDVLALVAAFQQRYGTRPRIFRAPGRVNLIGEHTDYNDGFVLPMAIDRETAVAIAGRNDRILRIWSLNLDDFSELDLNNVGTGHHGTWIDYVEGTVSALAGLGLGLAGADVALKSDVGIGSGLASSAALEIALGTALISVAGGTIDSLSLALAGQTAEHMHVGTQCGIMDQFVSVHALKNHAILLDCRTLQAKQIPLNMHEYETVICDSKVRHTLASSEYNQRRRDCRSGVKLLGVVLPGVRALRDVTPRELTSHRSLLPETVFRRCRHVINENARALKAAVALSSGDFAGMGRLMSESHQSLRDDYQVSCSELDILVESANAQPGVLGARMTGGGFGGCTVNLVKRRTFESFRENVSREYQKKTGIAPEIFAVHARSGAGEMTNDELKAQPVVQFVIRHS
jgi:galactokinase